MAFPQLLVWQVLTLSSEKMFFSFFARLLVYFLHVYYIITVYYPSICLQTQLPIGKLRLTWNY